MLPDADIIAGLPTLHRFALAYAPRAARAPTLALLALDARLAGIVRSGREAMLAQVRPAWWRDRLGEAAGTRPAGEPLLALLGTWGGHAASLVALVDGWEQLVGDVPLPASGFAALAAARGDGFATLAGLLGEEDAAERVRRAAHDWALVDIAAHLSDPAEREALAGLVAARDWTGIALPRSVRPLAVLRGLAARSTRRGDDYPPHGPSALAAAVRLGLAGR